MKIICAFSSIEFTVEHFPITLSSRESYHPIFDIPQRSLIPLLSKWSSGGLTPTDSYLLFLAALKSTELVNFRVPAIRTTQTDSLIAQNMEALFRAIIRITSVSNPAITFPHYVVSRETRDLENVKYWIANWLDSYQNFQSGYANDILQKKLAKKEAVLDRLIMNSHVPISRYAGSLAEWAAVAGNFPEYLTPNHFHREPARIPMAEFWKEIIVKCANAESVFSVPKQDLYDLLEHCETNIDFGTKYSMKLFELLRNAVAKQKNFLELGDQDLSTTLWQFPTEGATTEQSNIQGLILAATEEEPQRKNYETNFQYLKARSRWLLAKRYGKGGADKGESNE